MQNSVTITLEASANWILSLEIASANAFGGLCGKRRKGAEFALLDKFADFVVHSFRDEARRIIGRGMKERLSDDKNMLMLDAVFEGFTPAEMFDYWTKPELLAQWNADRVECDLRVGGEFAIVYESLGWKVSGKYIAVNPPNHLEFTWRWDHDPGTVQSTVDVTFTEPEAGGTLVVIRQGPFGDSDADLLTRQAVAEGWLHFGMRLAGLKPGDVEMGSSMG